MTAGATIETTGKLHGLMRKIGKIGGEVITFSLTIKDLEEWNRLIAFAEQPVAITITTPQQELPLGEGVSGVQPGSQAASGSHQAQD